MIDQSGKTKRNPTENPPVWVTHGGPWCFPSLGVFHDRLARDKPRSEGWDLTVKLIDSREDKPLKKAEKEGVFKVFVFCFLKGSSKLFF